MVSGNSRRNDSFICLEAVNEAFFLTEGEQVSDETACFRISSLKKKKKKKNGLVKTDLKCKE